jgi:squalene-hopene/tetraprenyl-beta-curcumene cyclase
MKKLVLQFCLLALVCPGLLRGQEVASTWQGTFESDSGEHRAVLEIFKGQNGGGRLGAFFVEYFSEQLQINSVILDGSNLKVVLNGGRGSYQGKLSADGALAKGTWTYNRSSSPLELRRLTTEAAWQVPFPNRYQYHYRNIDIPRPSAQEAKIPFSLKLAVDYMEQGALAWGGEWGCVACHTNGSYMVVRPLMTAQLGPPQQKLREFFVNALREQSIPDPDDPKWAPEPTQVVYIAAGLAIWDANVTHKLSPETAQALGLMFKLQRQTADWYIEDDNNPPFESSPYQLATVAARAVGNAPGWLAQQRGKPVEAQVQRLEEYLRAEKKLQADYDRTDLLWAASELPGFLDDNRKQKLIEMVFSHQMPDGGWSIRTFAKPEEWGKGNRAEKLRAELEFKDPQSDGHMTGLAIIALRKAGVSASDPRIRRGVAWLLANQRSSGRWWTRSLIGDNWQLMSYSSTAYPLLALSLCDALPVGSGMQAARR